MASSVKMGDSPWIKIGGAVLVAHLLLLVAGIFFASLFSGFAGAAGFCVGVTVVFLWFGLDLLLAHYVEKKSMTEVARGLIVSYCMKVVAGFFLLFYFPLPAVILNGWLLCGVIFAVCVWLGVSMRTIMKLRILYFDDRAPTNLPSKESNRG